MDWNNKPQVKKGNAGEAILDEYLIERGIVPYAPVANRAHPFDRLCAKSDKSKIFIVEVKTKAARTWYPDTGINISHLNDYLNIQNSHTINVFVAFVDELKGEIYGNYLNILMEPKTVEHISRNGLLKTIKYPLRNPPIIYFPLISMRPLATISEDNCAILMELSTRTYEYAETK